MSEPIPASEVCVTCDPVESTSTATQETPSVPTPSLKVEAEDVLNPATFVPPVLSAVAPSIVIEFCDRVSSFVIIPVKSANVRF